MSTAGHPEPVEVTDELVTSLIASQFPDLARFEVGRHYALENHVSVRWGDDYGAVLPTVGDRDHFYARAEGLIAPLRRHWTFPWSGPIRTGVPGASFPYHWVIVPWISASVAAYVPLNSAVAPELGEALRQIHTKAPAGAPAAGPSFDALGELQDEWEALLTASADIEDPEGRVIDNAVANALWDNGVRATGPTRRTWIHGNLEPRAVLSDQGRFAGLLLWHLFGAGNPAYDLASIALLIPTEARAEMYRGYGALTPAERERIQALELLLALRYVGGTDPFRTRLAWHRLIELGIAVQP